MRRRVIALLGLIPMTGCTPAELAAWVQWYANDPVAATEFANRPEVQEALAGSMSAEPSIPRESLWDDIAWCESGGRWDHPPVSNRHGTFSGGLMIGHQWWGHYGGQAPAPYLATKAEQIEVAENIAADAGLDDAWQCYP